MEWVIDPQIWGALLTLTALEIVLGVDNVILISVLADRLPRHLQSRARNVGLALALASRLALLAGVAWSAGLTAPIFEAMGRSFSCRDLILIIGGLFLVYSGTREIHRHIEGDHIGDRPRLASTSFARIVVQIVLFDLVFSLDSIITAVGMTNELWVMSMAVIIALAVMCVAATPVATFIGRHPTVKVLVLSFLLLIGMALITDGFGVHVPKAYIYVAIGFSIGVEVLNQLAARRWRTNTQAKSRNKDRSLPSSMPSTHLPHKQPGRTADGYL